MSIYNRPGLKELSYRIDTHGSFLQRMLDQLPAQAVPGGGRPLAALTTRSPDDPAIALLDAWASVADVLTFYQERIANEGFLRTAQERFSVLEMARSVGYEPNPGVAASAHLAFMVEDAQGAPLWATVSAGTKVMSVPAPGQQPQTFETVAEITARAEWNELRPQISKPQVVTKGITTLWLRGTGTQLKPGDIILILGDERLSDPASGAWDLRVLSAVQADSGTGLTRVTWEKPLGGIGGGVVATRNIRVYALRQRASLFGYNAVPWLSMPPEFRRNYHSSPADNDWPGFGIAGTETEITLDGTYSSVGAGDWVAVGTGDGIQTFRVQGSSTVSASQFAIAAKVTRLKLDKAIGEFVPRVTLDRRTAVIFLQSEPLELAEEPITRPVDGVLAVTEPVVGPQITLDRLVTAPARSQTVIVSGRRVRLRLRTDVTGGGFSLKAGDTVQSLGAPAPAPSGKETWQVKDRNGRTGVMTLAPADRYLVPATAEDAAVSEVAAVVAAAPEAGRLKLTLNAQLACWYDPVTVRIAANVAPATHGEAVREILGGGDATRTHQRFTLKRPPLTYVSASTPSGAAATLEIRVGGVLWAEAPSLYGLGARDQSYIIRLGPDGKPAVIFGDGRRGARLPTGQENVAAVYRTGLGLAGNVDAGSLSLLQTRPAGIKGVSNPIAAGGGADPETLDQARSNAPKQVLTLDRIVSLQDYADFANAFTGIGKATAALLWMGDRQVVCVTVADAAGETVAPGSALATNLLRSLRQFGAPTQSVMVVGYRPRSFAVTARLMLDVPRYEPDRVMAAVRAALAEAFAFARRQFAQPVTAAEVITVIQMVAGVVAVDLTRFRLDGDTAQAVPAVLTARGAEVAATGVEAAELILIDPGAISLQRG